MDFWKHPAQKDGSGGLGAACESSGWVALGMLPFQALSWMQMDVRFLGTESGRAVFALVLGACQQAHFVLDLTLAGFRACTLLQINMESS